MKVGDTIWRLDCNRRVYTKDPRKPFGGELIRREQWVPTTISGETARSWLVARWAHDQKPIKIPKKGPRHGWAFTPREVELDVFIVGLRGDIHHRFQNTVNQDQETALKIARLLGFEIPPELEELS